jgi:DNA methylase
VTAAAGVAAALNGICAYFTMFPLRFPHGVLQARAEPGDVVLDPFCGRGTTNYASRILGLPNFGVDSSPVAVALSQAKLANAAPAAIVLEAERILRERPSPASKPTGEFWDLAYHPDVLDVVCRLREGLLADASSDARRALRAIVLGALHGPIPKVQPPTYLSNQCQRTYAPKPGYAVRFWRSRELMPPAADVLTVIRTRAERYYGSERSLGRGAIALGDSRDPVVVRTLLGDRRARWVISSPPYYGLDTYFPDQWLRYWFVGGPDRATYASPGQLDHHSPRVYVAQLRQVWRNAAAVSAPGANMVVRFGGIRDRKAGPLALIAASLGDSGWIVDRVTSAGTAMSGKRQAHQFSGTPAKALQEYDLWATRLD